MKSVYRWIASHSGLCKVLLFLLLSAFTFYAATLEHISFVSIYLLDLLVWFVVGRFIATAPLKLLREPMDAMQHQCDPHSLMEETQRQLGTGISGPYRQQLQLNYAVTLRLLGEFRKALEILEDINIDKFSGTAPSTKYAYYHNLCDLNYILGRKEEARVWHRKIRQLYNDLPNPMIRQELAPTYELMEAEILYYEADPSEALQKVSRIPLPHKIMVLDAALLAAKCHIALEEPEKAREKLQYVIDQGNKLHIVQEALALLETLN